MYKSKENSIMMPKSLLLGSLGSRLWDADRRSCISALRDNMRKQKSRSAEGETELKCSPNKDLQQPYVELWTWDSPWALSQVTERAGALTPLRWSVIGWGSYTFKSISRKMAVWGAPWTCSAVKQLQLARIFKKYHLKSLEIIWREYSRWRKFYSRKYTQSW